MKEHCFNIFIELDQGVEAKISFFNFFFHFLNQFFSAISDKFARILEAVLAFGAETEHNLQNLLAPKYFIYSLDLVIMNNMNFFLTSGQSHNSK